MKKNLKNGGILVYAMILAVAFGFISISLMTPASFEGPKVSKEEKKIQMFFAANSGLELLRGIMYYNTRTTFAGYLNKTIDSKVFTFDGLKINFSIKNNIDDGWGGATNDGDGILEVSSTAHRGEIGNSDAIRVLSQFMLLSTTKYSFASNQWGGGYMDGEQHWYGDVYWYTNYTTSHPEIRGKSYFHGDFTSWNYKLAINKRNTFYTDTFNTHQAYERRLNSTSGYIYDQSSPRNLLQELQPVDTFEGAQEFKPLPGLVDIKNEIGTDNTTPGTIRKTAYDQLEKNTAGEMKRSHFFDGTNGVGTESDNVLPKSAEIFLHPNGSIWWRPRGGKAGTYTKDLTVIENQIKANTPAEPAETYQNRYDQAYNDAVAQNNLRWRKSDLVQTDGMVLYFGEDVWVKGVVNKRITIASERNVYINGNIINQDFDYAHLVMIAKANINEEVRKEYLDNGVNKILNVRSTSSTTVNPAYGNFIADRTFTDAEYNAIINNATTPIWLKNEMIRWKNYPGVLSDQAIIESSLIGDRICPTVYFTSFSNGTSYTYKYHSWILVPGSSWRVSGTYFIAGLSYDYVEHWSYAPGGKASYHEHIGARSAPPPYGITNNDQVPIYRSNGYYWRIERITQPIVVKD